MKISPMKSIRAKCLDCSCDSFNEVKECWDKACALWPYRLGHGWQDPVTGQITKSVKVELSEEKRAELSERMLRMRANQVKKS